MYLPSRIRDIPDEGLLALYLLHQAAVKKSNCVVLENSFLRQWLKVSRVYEEKATGLAKKLKSVFPEFTVSTDDKNRTTLRLKLEPGLLPKNVSTLSIHKSPPLEEVEKSLGFRPVQISVDRI